MAFHKKETEKIELVARPGDMPGLVNNTILFGWLSLAIKDQWFESLFSTVSLEGAIETIASLTRGH